MTTEYQVSERDCMTIEKDTLKTIRDIAYSYVGEEDIKLMRKLLDKLDKIRVVKAELKATRKEN